MNYQDQADYQKYMDNNQNRMNSANKQEQLRRQNEDNKNYLRDQVMQLQGAFEGNSKKMRQKSTRKPRLMRNLKNEFQTVDHSPFYSLENIQNYRSTS